MNTDYVFAVVVVQKEKAVFFPVFEGAYHIFLRIVEFIRDIANACVEPGAHHADQI